MFDAKLNELHDRMQRCVTTGHAALQEIEDAAEPSESFAQERMDIHAKAMDEYDDLKDKAEAYQRQLDAEAESERLAPKDPRIEVADAPAEVEDEGERYARCFETYTRGGRNALAPDDAYFMEQRAQAAGTDAKGGYFVPEQVANTVVEQMEHYTPFLSGGVFTILNTSHGQEINYPTVNDTGNDASLVAENAAVGEQDIAVGEVPINAYKYTSNLVKVSHELLMDSQIPVAQILGNAFGKRMGRGVNTALTTGTGSSQPQGIVTGASAALTTASATALTADEIIRAQQSLDPAYEGNPSVRWMMNRGIQTHIRTLKDSDNRYLWSAGDMRTGTPDELLGVQVIINPAMDSGVASTNKTLLYGDMSVYLVRNAGGARMVRLDERYADNDQVGFLYFHRFDGAVLDSAGLKVVTQKT